MRWTVTLVAEVEPRHRIGPEIAPADRADRITPVTMGVEDRRGQDGVGGTTGRNG